MLGLESGDFSFSSTDKVEPNQTESHKPSEGKGAKAVWQFGGVTIPLVSQETEVKLSEQGKALIAELEDLTFMQSPVLMFPIKSS